MIKAIIFDCFGVLTTDKWREFTATLPRGPMLDKARELNLQYGAGFLTLQQFLEQIETVTGKQPQQVESLLSHETTKNEQLLAFIETLKPKYKIGLLSNIATNWITTTFLTTKEQALFDDMVMSFKVKMTKPNPRIFKLACERLGVRPDEAVMVDDIESYGKVAEGIGMKTIIYEDFSDFKQDLQNILEKV